jgi:hypothetical protein
LVDDDTRKKRREGARRGASRMITSWIGITPAGYPAILTCTKCTRTRARELHTVFRIFSTGTYYKLFQKDMARAAASPKMCTCSKEGTMVQHTYIHKKCSSCVHDVFKRQLR